MEPLLREEERTRILLGNLLAKQNAERPLKSIQDAEFQVFSQWGEDGILQYLIHKVPIENRAFIEFGVESYAESSTRFLLVNNNWRGLILDGGTQHRQFTARRGLQWRHQLEVVSAFITQENVNQLFEANGFVGDLGILSIDVDGNDYWIWKAVNVVSPRIVVVEFNSTFGTDHSVTVPYRPDFRRSFAHYSNLYWGASLAAFCELGQAKGYKFVGCNSAGNNAFFVRHDVGGGIRELSVVEGFEDARFRESRDRSGHLSYLTSRRSRLWEIAELPVTDLRSGRSSRVADIFAAELG